MTSYIIPNAVISSKYWATLQMTTLRLNDIKFILLNKQNNSCSIVEFFSNSETIHFSNIIAIKGITSFKS